MSIQRQICSIRRIPLEKPHVHSYFYVYSYRSYIDLDIKMKRLLTFIFIVALSGNQLFAATTTATSSGDWDVAGTWDNGAPGCFDTIIIPVGITVTVTDQENLESCPGTYIWVQGELHFQSGKKIDLPCGSAVYMDAGPPAGQLTGGGGGGNSNWIKICNIVVWSAGDGNLTGPEILCIGCSLPIELVSFTAKMRDDDRKADLDWVTASEQENDYFTIERSPNGEDWIEIVDVDGAGNSNTTLHYHEVDANPLFGVSYYRLKQTDFNGEFSYSPIVKLSQYEIEAIEMYPNPANEGDQVVMNFPKGHGSPVEVNIFAMDGKIVYQATFDITDTQQLIIDIGLEFQPGMYTVKTQYMNAKLIVR